MLVDCFLESANRAGYSIDVENGHALIDYGRENLCRDGGVERGLKSNAKVAALVDVAPC